MEEIKQSVPAIIYPKFEEKYFMWEDCPNKDECGKYGWTNKTEAQQRCAICCMLQQLLKLAFKQV